MIPLVDIAEDIISHQTLDDITAEARTSLHIDLDGSSDGDDSGSDSSSTFGDSSDNWGDMMDDLTTDVQCLIDLDLMIQSPIFDSLLRGCGGHGKDKMAPDWEPHLSYSDKIVNRFPAAAAGLVNRLARANWERFQKTNASREKNIAVAAAAAVNDAEEQPIVQGIISAVVVTDGGSQIAESQTEPVSKFHDSGLGDSVRTGSTYADTIMSYQARGRESVRIPPLPEGAKQGNPFNCVACGRLMVIMNNSDWK